MPTESPDGSSESEQGEFTPYPDFPDPPQDGPPTELFFLPEDRSGLLPDLVPLDEPKRALRPEPPKVKPPPPVKRAPTSKQVESSVNAAEPIASAALEPFRVLIVCQANHCRSPLIEHLLRQALARDTKPGWIITSAGTHARPGLPCHPYITRILRKRGIDPGNWTSSVLDLEKIENADLILTSGLEQRRQVVNMSFAAVGRTFPLLAFAAWLENDVEHVGEPKNGVELLESARRGRARTQPLTPSEQNLRDPIGHGYRQFRYCARKVDKAIASIASAVAPSVTTWGNRL